MINLRREHDKQNPCVDTIEKVLKDIKEYNDKVEKQHIDSQHGMAPETGIVYTINMDYGRDFDES